MEQIEFEQRLAIVVALYGALGRYASDDSVAMIVSGTSRIPFPWMRKACHDLAGSWDEGQRNPGAPAIFRQACNAAGFRAIYRTHDYEDPTPAAIRWWPPAGVRLPESLGECWNRRPSQLLASQVSPEPLLLVPGGAS
jgi:hypothetical protein